jgi:transposase
MSGIVHGLKSGCRWCDCPPEYGPPTTIYNRFVRWVRRGIWETLFRELAGNGRSAETQMIDSTHVKAHRSAAGGKGGSKSRLLAARAEGATRRFTLADAKGRLIAIMLTGGEAHDCPVAESLICRVDAPKCMIGDKACDSAELREDLDEFGTKPVIPIAPIGSSRSALASISTSYVGGSKPLTG